MMKSIRLTTQPAGAAMIEMVLCLPLIFVVIILMYFMGSRMWYLQQTEFVIRYETWRAVHNGPSPRGYISSGSSTWNTDELRESFFGDQIDSLGIGWVSELREPYEAFEEFSQTVASEMPDSNIDSYLEEVVNQQPQNVALQTNVNLSSQTQYLDQFASSITRRHARIGQGWWVFWPGRVQYEDGQTPPLNAGVDNQTELRDSFYRDFHESMSTQTQGNAWATSIRDFYQRRPWYRGPEVYESDDEEE